MDEPNYVLKTNDADLMPVEQGGGFRILKAGVWVVAAVLIFGSLIFGDNLFLELSWTARVLLIATVIRVAIGSRREYVPSPIELQFYNDYLIMYRPKHYYNRRVTRMEVDKMMYSGITRCVYKAKSQRIHIYGDVEAKWYNYNKNGVVSQTPTYDRVVRGTLYYISTVYAPDVDFKKEMEEHSPIRVTVEIDG